MDTLYRVIANVVNVRSSPSKENNDNVITTLSEGNIVTLVNNNNAIWFNITFTKNNNSIIGFIAASLLELVTDNNIPPIISDQEIPPAVHFRSNIASNRNSVDFRHCPLSESSMPTRTESSTEIQIQEIHQILDFLSVATSLRYKPINNGQTTYCNIYAYDVCFLAKVYLPRVWWTEKALLSIQQKNQVSIVYGDTVRELRANDLFDWLDEWGHDYGWIRTFDLTEQQNQVNKGNIGIICAKRLDTNRSGHIVIVVPEITNFSARRSGSSVLEPLQSQAGVSNKKMFNNSNQWWTKPNTFRDFGFWYHV